MKLIRNRTRPRLSKRPLMIGRQVPIRTTAALLAALVLPLSTAPVPARAAEVYVAPAVSVAAGHDDNLRLDPAGGDDQSILQLIGEAEVGSKTRTREAVLNAAAQVNRYSDSQLDSTDWHLDLDLLRRARRDELELLTSYRRASTLTTELEDTGRLQQDRERRDWSIAPSWTHQLSRRTETKLLYQFTDVAYQGGSATGLTDYRDHLVESSVTHSLNRTTDLYGRADYTRFESEQGTNSDNVSLLAGLERNFSRRLHAGFGLGARYIDSDFLTPEGTRQTESDSGLIYEARAAWTLETGMVSVEGSRTVQSSGLGTLADVDSLQAAWTQSLSRTWELNVNGGASWRDFAATGTQGSGKRRYYNAETRLVWRGWPRWQVDLAYQYRRQAFDNPQAGENGTTGDSADSNAVWLTMRYAWARIDPFR